MSTPNLRWHQTDTGKDLLATFRQSRARQRLVPLLMLATDDLQIAQEKGYPLTFSLDSRSPLGNDHELRVVVDYAMAQKWLVLAGESTGSDNSGNVLHSNWTYAFTELGALVISDAVEPSLKEAYEAGVEEGREMEAAEEYRRAREQS